MADFSFKSQFPVAQYVQAQQQRANMEQQAQNDAESQRLARFNQLLSALSTGAQISRSIKQGQAEDLANQSAQRTMGLQKQLDTTLNQGYLPTRPTPLSPSLSQGVQGPQPVEETQTISQTPQFGANVKRLLTSLNPEIAAKSMFSTQQSKGQLRAYTDSNGVSRYGQFDPFTREFIRNEETDPEVGYAPVIQTDPTTGFPFRTPRQGGAAKEVELPKPDVSIKDTPDKLNPVEKKRIIEVADDVSKDETVQSAKQTINDLTTLRQLLIDNSPQSSGAIQGLATRSLGREKGVTTDRDILRNTGSQAYADRFFRFIEKAKSGKLDEADRQGFLELVESIGALTQSRLDGTVGVYIGRVKGLYPNISDDLIAKQINPSIRFEPAKKETRVSSDIQNEAKRILEERRRKASGSR